MAIPEVRMPNDEVRQITDRYGLPAKTEYTITDGEELFDQLEQTREQGMHWRSKNHCMDSTRSVRRS